MQSARRSALLVVWTLFAFVLIPSARADNLVVNGGFETGNFTGWTTSGAAFNCGDTAVDGISNLSPHSGSYSACFGNPSAPSYIAQYIATVPGQSYDFTFYFAQQPTDQTPDNAAGVYWDSGWLGIYDDLPVTSWSEWSEVVTATSTSTLVGLGAMNVPGWVALDDVSVDTITPEPAPVLLCGSGLLLALFVFARRAFSRG
jgi:hypothetical protein